jgi:MoaA/NifB/PqqE/SkfB family radical SAM enzyme
MTTRHTAHEDLSMAKDMVLDGHKLPWHMDRVAAWERGERIAPITIDMALTRACNYSCTFCYAMLQENDRSVITWPVMDGFLHDCQKMGVRGISLVSDGESTISPAFENTILMGHALGMQMAVGTNGYVLNPGKMNAGLLSALTYIRINFSAGEPERYASIMGVKEDAFHKVCANIRNMVDLKRKYSLKTTIGIQMVLMPQDGDQIMPFARLGKELGVDYAIIKHCSDDEHGSLGVDYNGYGALYPLLKEAEELSDDRYTVAIKWSKIGDKGTRSYQRCYGPPFIIQVSGSGLVAPCGMLFNDRYAKFHIGNITEERWYDIWSSDRYWEVMDYLGSEEFDAQKMCGSLCLQHKVNEALDKHVKGEARLEDSQGPAPLHVGFL